jgi:hypothetical protein
MMQYLAGEEELNHGKPTGGAQNVAEFWTLFSKHSSGASPLQRA